MCSRMTASRAARRSRSSVLGTARSEELWRRFGTDDDSPSPEGVSWSAGPTGSRRNFVAIRSFDDARRAVAAGTAVDDAARTFVAGLTPEERLWCLDGDAPTW